jgi:hypothetical protein
VLEEILEERAVSSRGRQVPRGVKRKMSNYPLRPRAPQPTIRIDFAAAIRTVKRTALPLARIIHQDCSAASQALNPFVFGGFVAYNSRKHPSAQRYNQIKSLRRWRSLS